MMSAGGNAVGPELAQFSSVVIAFRVPIEQLLSWDFWGIGRLTVNRCVAGACVDELYRSTVSTSWSLTNGVIVRAN